MEICGVLGTVQIQQKPNLVVPRVAHRQYLLRESPHQRDPSLPRILRIPHIYPQGSTFGTFSSLIDPQDQISDPIPSPRFQSTVPSPAIKSAASDQNERTRSIVGRCSCKVQNRTSRPCQYSGRRILNTNIIEIAWRDNRFNINGISSRCISASFRLYISPSTRTRRFTPTTSSKSITRAFSIWRWISVFRYEIPTVHARIRHQRIRHQSTRHQRILISRAQIHRKFDNLASTLSANRSYPERSTRSLRIFSYP